MEAEYNAMSMAMRDVLPLKKLLKEIMGKIGIYGNAMAKFRTTLWEDNLGALKLGRLEPGRMTPRSKQYGVKYHWFRTNLKPNDIEIVNLCTLSQTANLPVPSMGPHPHYYKGVPIRVGVPTLRPPYSRTGHS
jgi:hypothetical protein